MATYYFRNTGNTDWGLASNWSLTDGGGPTAPNFPTSSDDVIFTNNSGNVLVGPNRNTRNLSFTNWAGSINLNGVLMRVYGNLDFGSNLWTYSNPGIWQMGSTVGVMNGQTIQTNGRAIPGTLSFGYATGNNPVVLLGDITCGALRIESAVGSASVNIFTGFTMYVTGSISTMSAGRQLRASTPIIMIGTGTITTFDSSAFIGSNITINTAGTITFSGTVCFQERTLTYIAGTVNNAGSTLVVNNATTLNTIGINWNNVLFNGTSATLTLTTDLHCNQFTMGVNNKTINGANIYNAGNLYAPSNTGNVQGTSTIIMNGTGTINAAGGAYFGINIIINTIGTITLSSFNYGIATFKYISGTIINSGTLTTVQGSATLDTAGMSFLNVSTNGSYTTLSLPTLLTVTGKLSFPSNTTIINGAGGFTCSGLSIGSGTLTLPAGVTNTVTATMSCLTATLAAKALINCSTVGGTKAILKLAQDAIQDNGYLSATDVDSSGGRSLWTYKGVLTRTSNWNLMPTSPKKQVIKHGNMIMKY